MKKILLMLSAIALCVSLNAADVTTCNKVESCCKAKVECKKEECKKADCKKVECKKAECKK